MADEIAESQTETREEEAPKPRRRRRTKAEMEAARAAEAAARESGGEAEAPKRRRGRPRKVEQQPDEQPPADAAPSGQNGSTQAGDSAPKRRRGRPRKVDTAPAVDEAEAAVPASEGTAAGDTPQNPSSDDAPKPRRRRMRSARAAEGEQLALGADEPVADSADPMTRLTQSVTVASSVPTEVPATTLADADARAAGEPVAETAGSDAARRRPAPPSQPTQTTSGAQAAGANRKRNKQSRRNRRSDAPAEPSVTREELDGMLVAELRARAAELGIDAAGVRKRELVDLVYEANARAEGFRPVSGVLDFQNEGYAFLRTGNYMRGDDDAFVHQQLIRSLGLRPGDEVTGTVGPARPGNKYPPLQRVESVNGHAPEGLRERPRFRDLTPIFPDERLVMEHGKDSTTGRAIDLVAPIGKGQRGLIVSPPKAGKTTVLKRICQSIAANNPEVHLFCLLVDERPEEVTDMERSIRGRVVASTFDMPADNHTTVAELVIEHAKRLVEEGEDVVVVLDSITRLARAYNLAAPASGRILSGGVDSAALYPPKRFLGAARNIEHGGSLTILASALVDTGSKMDEVIFEEFKGTGNMELKLDRDLADRRIFPAIDPVSSGTRNEELLIGAEMQPFVWGIRRVLANMNNTERAATALVRGLRATTTNEEFLIRSAKKAAQQELTV